MPPKASFTREDGLYHSFCGLVSVGWLYQKIKDSFFLILGTHTLRPSAPEHPRRDDLRPAPLRCLTA
jgi:hypothetical protein